MSRTRSLIVGILVGGVWLAAAQAADLGTITFTRSIGMGISATAGSNTLIQNNNQTGTQCLPPGSAHCDFDTNSKFTNPSNPFEARVECGVGAVVGTVCKARFDPGLPDAFDTLPVGGTQFGAQGVPCGSGDPNFDPETGFPYDCNSAGTIYQIVPKGLLQTGIAASNTCVTPVNTSIEGTNPSNTCVADPHADTQTGNIRLAPPGGLIVGAPFQVYSSYKSGVRRIHHIEDGFQQQDGGPASGQETPVDPGSTITRFLFVIDVITDATGHITDNGQGFIRADGKFILEMDDRHLMNLCQVPINFGGGAAGVRANSGLGSFQAGDELSLTGAGLLMRADGRPECFNDVGGGPCPTSRALDVVIGSNAFCPGDSFPP